MKTKKRPPISQRAFNRKVEEMGYRVWARETTIATGEAGIPLLKIPKDVAEKFLVLGVP